MENLLGLVAFYCVFYAVAFLMKKPEPAVSALRGLAFFAAGMFALGFLYGFASAVFA